MMDEKKRRSRALVADAGVRPALFAVFAALSLSLSAGVGAASADDAGKPAGVGGAAVGADAVGGEAVGRDAAAGEAGQTGEAAEAAAVDVEALFGELFGARAREVESSRSPMDDVELGRELLKASEMSDLPASFQLLLAERAVGYSSRHPSGVDDAERAIERVSEIDEGRTRAMIEQVLGAHEQRISQASGEAREQYVWAYFERLMQLAGLCLQDADAVAAQRVNLRAMRAARLIGPEAVSRVQLMVKDTTPLIAQQRQLDRLIEQYTRTPAAAAATQIAMIYIVSFDAPSRAQRYALASGDEALALATSATLAMDALAEAREAEAAASASEVATEALTPRQRRALRLQRIREARRRAAAGVEAAGEEAGVREPDHLDIDSQFSPAQLRSAGEWFVQTSSEASESRKAALLKRSRALLNRFLQRHGREDAEALAVNVVLKRVNEQLASLDHFGRSEIAETRINLLPLVAPRLAQLAEPRFWNIERGALHTNVGNRDGWAGYPLNLPIAAAGDYEVSFDLIVVQQGAMIRFPLGRSNATLSYHSGPGSKLGGQITQHAHAPQFGRWFVVNSQPTTAQQSRRLTIRVTMHGSEAQLTVLVDNQEALSWRGEPTGLADFTRSDFQPTGQFAIAGLRFGELYIGGIEARGKVGLFDPTQSGGNSHAGRR